MSLYINEKLNIDCNIMQNFFYSGYKLHPNQHQELSREQSYISSN